MTAVLSLGDCLDMTAAAPLTHDLTGRRGQPITLDAGSVRRLGAQCLQVLLAAEAAWAADGQAFAIVNPSPEFAEGLALMGASYLAAPGPATLVQE